MTLVDTSAWVEFFRGKGPIAQTVDELIESDDAVLCGPVLTELHRGLRSERERQMVLPLLGALRSLPQPVALWEEAGELGHALARKGVTAKTLDLLIAAYALAHDVGLLATDRDFAEMRRAGVPITLV